MNTRTAKLKRYNIIHGHLDCLFYPMNDSVESDIEDTYKKSLISSKESSTIYVFCKQKLSDRAILIHANSPVLSGSLPDTTPISLSPVRVTISPG